MIVRLGNWRSKVRPGLSSTVLRVGLMIFFVWLAGRHWHPYYGFTRFLQMDELALATTVPELRTAPIFSYESGYDGHYYAQLAARPAVRDPELAGGFDNVPYRARRILLSWVAWVVGGGEPVAAVRAYAALNLVVWGVLAALLWQIFPVVGWRETVAWSGLLFSAGVLHSVRLALTDLLALLLTAAAFVQAEKMRTGRAALLLGLGGLARETVLLGVVSLLPLGRATFVAWRRALGWVALAGLFLTVWLLYLRLTWGGGVTGWGNFAVPVVGWLGKWSEIWRWVGTEGDRLLLFATGLAHVGVSIQLLYMVWRPAPADRWWRLGAVYGALMLLLGTAVWEGHPGAATRILLPLGLAFNVLSVRARASLGWLVLGNLSVLSGVLALWAVPQHAHELAAGRVNGGGYVVRTDAGWNPTEFHRNQTWAWSSTEGRLCFDFYPQQDATYRVQLALRSVSSRPLEIRLAGRVLWSGEIGEKIRWIELPVVVVQDGKAELELHSSAEAVRENAAAGGRALGFAIYGVRID